MPASLALTKADSLGGGAGYAIALPDVFGATSNHAKLAGQLPQARESPCDAAPCPDPSRPSFTRELWGRVERMAFSMIKHNPFLAALLDGSLDPQSFQCYLAQNLFYLRDYVRAVTLLEQAAPRSDWAATLAKCREASEGLVVSLQQDFGRKSSGLAGADDVGPIPTKLPHTVLYTSYLLSSVHERPFHEGVAALLPCLVLYFNLCEKMVGLGCPHPVYQSWLEMNICDSFRALIARMEGMLDEMALGLSQEQRERIHDLYLMGCRLEYIFWEGAYQQRGWPF